MFANLFNRKPQGLGMFGGQPETYDAMGGFGPQSSPAMGAQGGWQPHNQDALYMGLGMLSGRNNAEAFGGALKGAALSQEAKNRAQGGSMATDKIKNFMFAKQQGFEGTFQEWMRDEGTDSEFGLNPQYGVDEQGNPVIIQLNKSGQAQKTPLPAGVSLSKEPIKLDAGTHFVLLDPITRQPVGQIPKDLAGAASQTAQGTAQGQAVAELPGHVTAAEKFLTSIEDVRNDPNRVVGTGKSSMFNSLPASKGFDFQQKVDQLKGKSFIEAYQGLKGGGAISEAEGMKAEQAIARLNTAQSEEAFVEALDDLKDVVNAGLKRSYTKANRQQPGREDPLGIR